MRIQINFINEWLLCQCSMEIWYVCFFSVAGYDAAITIKQIKADDLFEVENFAKTIPDLISTYCTNKKITLDADYINKVHQLFLGLYASNSKEFQFRKGEAVLILQASNFVMHKVSRTEAEDDFSFFLDIDCDEKLSPTVKTSIGEFFAMRSEDETCLGAICWDKTPNIGR